MKVLSIASIFFWLLSFTDTTALVGRWETKPSVDGNVTGVVIKDDGSFEAYVNKKPFTSGNYTYQDSIFSFTDNGCMGMTGSYKTVFFSDADSLRFDVIADSCTERKEGMSRLVLGKVKKSAFTSHSILFIIK